MKKAIFLLLACLPLAASGQQDSFLLVSDIHLLPTQWGSSGGQDGDTPGELFLSAVREMQQHPVKYMLVPGDFLWHADTRDSSIMRKVFQYTLDKLAATGATIIPAVGNNDFINHNIGDSASYQLFYDVFLQKLDIAGHIKNTFIKGGYYDYPVNDSLSVIALNTTLFLDGCYCGVAARKQLVWLREVLSSYAGHKKAWLLYHIPPGIDRYEAANHKADSLAWTDAGIGTYEQAFLQLVKDNHETIRYQLAGHTHMDDNKIITHNGQLVSYIHIAPGLSYRNKNNPAYQLVKFDQKTFDITDVDTYFTRTNQPYSWLREYSFKQAFGSFDFSYLLGNDPFGMGKKVEQYYNVSNLPVQAPWGETFQRQSVLTVGDGNAY